MGFGIAILIDAHHDLLFALRRCVRKISLPAQAKQPGEEAMRKSHATAQRNFGNECEMEMRTGLSLMKKAGVSKS